MTGSMSILEVIDVIFPLGLVDLTLTVPIELIPNTEEFVRRYNSMGLLHIVLLVDNERNTRVNTKAKQQHRHPSHLACVFGVVDDVVIVSIEHKLLYRQLM